MCDKSKVVCHILNVNTAKLSDVKIGDKNLFRAKILNEDKHREQ